MNTTTIFFDSWGRPHATCSPEHEGAGAFGPRGASIEAPGPRYAEALAAGLIDHGEDGDFPVLIPPPGLVEGLVALNRREDWVNQPEDHDIIVEERLSLFASAGLWPARWAWESRLID